MGSKIFKKRMGPIEKQGVVQAYTMLVPTVAIVMAIVLFPLLANFWISFKDVTVSDLRTAEIKVSEKFQKKPKEKGDISKICLLYTSPSPRDRTRSRMPSSA